MKRILEIYLMLISLFILTILSGCDFLFNSKQPIDSTINNQDIRNNNSQNSTTHTNVQDNLLQHEANVITEPKKALVFFQYAGYEGEKQQKLIQNLRKRIAPKDVTIVKKNSSLKFNLQGHYSYILFTGDHGEFANKSPLKFNGVMADKLQHALKNSDFSADVLIFDTCFSSSFIPYFISAKKINPGGKIICAHGECQGYSQAINDAESGSSLSSIFTILLQSLDDLGANYNSLSIYVQNNNGNINSGVLYVRKYNNRRQALESARFLGITDTENEIDDMEKYLSNRKITITKLDKESLKKIFYKNLKSLYI